MRKRVRKSLLRWNIRCLILKREEKSEEKLTEMEYKVFNLIKENPAVTYAYITDKTGVGETSVYKIIKSLKDKGWIKRNNGRKCGNWVIMKK